MATKLVLRAVSAAILCCAVACGSDFSEGSGGSGGSSTSTGDGGSGGDGSGGSNAISSVGSGGGTHCPVTNACQDAVVILDACFGDNECYEGECSGELQCEAKCVTMSPDPCNEAQDPQSALTACIAECMGSACDPSDPCDQANMHYSECMGGAADCSSGEACSGVNLCYAGCINEASCAQLVNPQEDTPYTACIYSCG